MKPPVPLIRGAGGISLYKGCARYPMPPLPIGILPYGAGTQKARRLLTQITSCQTQAKGTVATPRDPSQRAVRVSQDDRSRDRNRRRPRFRHVGTQRPSRASSVPSQRLARPYSSSEDCSSLSSASCSPDSPSFSSLVDPSVVLSFFSSFLLSDFLSSFFCCAGA